MQVTTTNDVKVYNISNGKSLPEWISERKRRKLLKDDEDLRRSIELIQDFEMPTAATHVIMTADGQYILAAGTYKPRVRCYDTSQLSMKFERCINSEVIAMTTLSDDYSKFVMLLSDRSLEFHVQHGSYYQTRIPVFGRDIAYHYPSCDLYIASSGSEVYRLNLEQGRYMASIPTQSEGSNVCSICEEHQLLAVGTEQGLVECYDPRSNTCVGVLDVSQEAECSVTALRFRDGLTMGVGTSRGEVLLYDIRMPRPLRRKDHYYQLPIVSLYFNKEQDLVLSSDRRSLRIWNGSTGLPHTSIEPDHPINSICPVANTGLVFMAVEDTKMLSYYIPSVGPAPKWCSFLDNLTEELEETSQSAVYDDYKFVTADDLKNLGLNHLIGTNTLKAYMHGYFMDMRLYNKVKSIVEPFAYEEYRKKKIKETLQKRSVNRARLKTLPNVNKPLALKLNQQKNKSNSVSNPLNDDRFSALFVNPDFEIDETSQEYHGKTPVQSKSVQSQSSNTIATDDDDDVSGDSESDDIQNEMDEEVGVVYDRPSVMIEEGDTSLGNRNTRREVSLGRLLDSLPDEEDVVKTKSRGSSEVTFKLKNKRKESKNANVDNHHSHHREERKYVRRSAAAILPKKRGPVYWRGRRVK